MISQLGGGLSPEHGDLAIGIQHGGLVEQRSDVGGCGRVDPAPARQQRCCAVDIACLHGSQCEPATDDDRKQREGRAEHGSDNIGRLYPNADPRARREQPISIVIPVWNGRTWLDGCLSSIAAQTISPLEVIAVDNGSDDDSVAHLRSAHPAVRVLELGVNTGFAHAVNRGIEAAQGDLVAVLNTDIVLDPDWLERMATALRNHPNAASVACKMLELGDDTRIYDAGDVLRRDGACEQRGRFCADDGSWNQPGEVFGACAGAALYRRDAVFSVGGFDERYFAYLEDVDLALALRMAGWRCLYEPVIARHAGEGSSHALRGGHRRLVARNTLLLVAKWFPARWLPLVAYRQAGWLCHALRERALADHLWGLAAGVALGAVAVTQRLRLAAADRSDPRGHQSRPRRVEIEAVIPRQPISGRHALGHPSRHVARPD